ncbi:MAG: glycosyltransferase family 4 protein [Bacteroidota bacterium]
MPSPRILFTSTRATTFINEDLLILRKHFDVEELIDHGFSAFLRILQRVRSIDITFTWFASVYSFAAALAAALMRRRSVIVIGGVDVSRHPDIGYGLWLSRWKGILAGYALRHADRVLTVDPALGREAMRLARYDGRNIRWVPTGYDSGFWVPAGNKTVSILTVASCWDETRLRAKGIDFLCQAARDMPSVQFTVIGIAPVMHDLVRSMAPDNLEILPSIPRNDLLQYYQSSKVFCQPSYTEGLPNSLCEAMLCECVPVGTRIGGIPTAMGEAGFLVPFGDVDGLVGGLRSALDSGASAGTRARQQIAENFTLERRERELVQILRELQ